MILFQFFGFFAAFTIARTLSRGPRCWIGLALGAGLFCVGCDEGGALCTRSTQCPAGHVCADGVCSPVLPQDGAAAADGRVDAGLDRGADHTVRPDVYGADSDGPLTCVPNNNGKVERNEMLFAVPAQVSVVRGTNLTVNLKGTNSGGGLVWDLTAKAVDDASGVMKVEAVPSWARASFVQASYASELSANYGLMFKVNLMGLFKVTSSALQLVGAVSDKANHTKLSYSGPVDMLRFPVVVGQSFSSSATVSGVTEYTIPTLMKETYKVQVLAKGKAKLYNTFAPDALLVKVDHEVYPVANPLLKVKNTVFLLVAECYGTVAHLLAAADPGNKLDNVAVKQRWKLSAP